MFLIFLNLGPILILKLLVGSIIHVLLPMLPVSSPPMIKRVLGSTCTIEWHEMYLGNLIGISGTLWKRKDVVQLYLIGPPVTHNKFPFKMTLATVGNIFGIMIELVSSI